MKSTVGEEPPHRTLKRTLLPWVALRWGRRGKAPPDTDDASRDDRPLRRRRRPCGGLRRARDPGLGLQCALLCGARRLGAAARLLGPRLGARRRDEPVRGPRLRAARLVGRPDPRPLLPR